MYNNLNSFSDKRQWRILFAYNLYRLITILLLSFYYVFGIKSGVGSVFFYYILLAYFIYGFFCFYLVRIQFYRFERFVLITGTLDIIVLSALLIIIGDFYVAYGIVLNVTIAYLSMMVPGRLAIFFASLSACFLLYVNFMSFLEGRQYDIAVFFYSGVYGAGFFATALTAWYLANWVRVSENLAEQRQEELLSMQRINEYIVGRLHAGIIYVDENKKIKLINSAVRKFFEIASNTTPQQLHQLSQELENKFEYFLLNTVKKEMIAQTFLQEPYLRVHFFSAEASRTPAVLIILEDMTFISQQAQQLKLASLGRFSASIAHELRNPLGAISHAVQLLGDTEELNQEDQHLRHLIINNCERMNGIIKNVLQLTRREQSQPQIINLNHFLYEFKEDFCRNNSKGECYITIKLPENKPLYIVFDKSQLEQILVILCENALQHGCDEKGHVEIVISTKNPANKTILTVSDSGPGVAPEHRENIFEPFFTTLRSGTGMGLFIARDLCEINQAQLSLLKSKIGSTFAITINPSDELLI